MGVRRLALALAAQGVSSVANLMIAIAAARLLGPTDFGRFTFFFTVMLFVVAMQTVCVGDSMTVLDRREPSIARGLAQVQGTFMLLGSVLAAAVAGVTVSASGVEIAALALLVAAWQAEEYTRRALMANRAYGRQVLADLTYFGATGISMVAADRVGHSVLSILIAMSVGATCAFAVGQALLPAEDRLMWPRLRSWSGTRTVLAYGSWRAGQAGTGYVSQLGVRYGVIALASAAALGNLEAARLAIAPVFTALAASTNVLLPSFAAIRGEGRAVFKRTLLRYTLLLSAATLVVAAVLLPFHGRLVSLLAGPEFDANLGASLSWLVLALVLAVTGPVSTAATVAIPSFEVFRWRTIGSAVGLACALLLVATVGAGWAPLGLAVALLVSTPPLALRALRSQVWLTKVTGIEHRSRVGSFEK